MSWTERELPDTLAGLDPETRDVALEIANRLVEEEGYEEGRALGVARPMAKRIVRGEA
jgi:uncharacterized protein YdaT